MEFEIVERDDDYEGYGYASENDRSIYNEMELEAMNDGN